MAYMTVDFSGEFEKIIRYFEDEMSKIEVRDIFAAVHSKNPPTATENYIRQKQNYKMERQSALRRALYRVLGTEEQQEKMFMSPAQQAAQRALEELEDRIDRNCRINIDLDF